MATPKRLHLPGTDFITTVTANRRRLFQSHATATLLLDTLQHYRREGHLKLHAFVIMPDHLHLLLTPQTITLERALMLIKGGFSRRLQSPHPVWQKGFTDHRIRDHADHLAHRDYIHHNPVRARLCSHPKAFPFSSAHHLAAPTPPQPPSQAPASPHA